MPSRYLQRNFKPNRFYHIFNRGGFGQKIFLKKQDYSTFTDILKHYLLYSKIDPLSRLSGKKLVKAKKGRGPKHFTLFAYCLMPNHFHLLLRQNLAAPTLTELLQKISVTYAMYFQYGYHHSGALFQGRFHSIEVDENQLLYLTKYIHLNPQNSVGTVPTEFPYSSLRDYLRLNHQYKDWLDSQTLYHMFFPKSLNAAQDYFKYLSSTVDLDQLKKQLGKKTLE